MCLPSPGPEPEPELRGRYHHHWNKPVTSIDRPRQPRPSTLATRRARAPTAQHISFIQSPILQSSGRGASYPATIRKSTYPPGTCHRNCSSIASAFQCTCLSGFHSYSFSIKPHSYPLSSNQQTAPRPDIIPSSWPKGPANKAASADYATWPCWSVLRGPSHAMLARPWRLALSYEPSPRGPRDQSVPTLARQWEKPSPIVSVPV